VVKSTSENVPKNNKLKLISKKKIKAGRHESASRSQRLVGSARTQGRGLGAAGAPPALVLIGFMGAGKSSVGSALSRKLGWTFEDLDQRIEQRTGRKVHEIFHDSGESYFRSLEHAVLQQCLEELPAGTGRILALGGGAYVQGRNARLIESAGIPTVFLDAQVEELWRRCQRQAEEDGWERPLLGSRESFEKLYESRRPSYLKASVKHETSGKRVEKIAAELIELLGLKNLARRGAKQ
jgi:shikimate kinase